MARIEDHERAIFLRKQGKSYSQIKEILKIGKGTLSEWLRNYPLSKQRIRELRDWSAIRIEKFRETMQRKREARLIATYKTQQKRLLPLSKKEFFMAGLFLYWGEGTKYRMNHLMLANTNPGMINFFINWLRYFFYIPKNKIKIRLHLYTDMDRIKEVEYWSKTVGIQTSQFSPSYIKKTSFKRINHKGGFGHGTCTVGIHSVSLTEKVLMSIQAISDSYKK